MPSNSSKAQVGACLDTEGRKERRIAQDDSKLLNECCTPDRLVLTCTVLHSVKGQSHVFEECSRCDFRYFFT